MNKQQTKKSQVVIGEETDSTEGFTERVLLSLVVDVSLLHESIERVRVQVFALAKEHGIEAPRL